MAEQNIEANGNSNNTNQPQEQTEWQISRDRQIQIIQDTAATPCPTLTNGVAKQLTYQQAMSIWLRASGLVRESRFNSISDAERKQQIEICYRQRRS